MTYPKIVTVEFWDCGKGHHHKSEETALKCMDVKPQIEKGVTRYQDTRKDVIRNVLSGDTFKTAGEKSGISESYARSIFWKQVRLVRVFARKELKIYLNTIYTRADVKANSTILLECFEEMWRI